MNEGINVLLIVLQSYKFCQGKLQLILDQLDPGQPKEVSLKDNCQVSVISAEEQPNFEEQVRYEGLQTLCSAPPSDVLNCENWTTLCEKLTVYLSDPDPVFSVRKCLQKC
ncbi:hypothetical protein J1605_012287 [Eschrichtius robustus]|uniref:BROMI middle region domain-containing protein n=1 Tax=Eschrichtius robustus TaxID=9764 RepID=A0AB34GM87_ESCRO|nr:hypothetical protein J1605_012287 [Eschrichtius robustus]